MTTLDPAAFDPADVEALSRLANEFFKAPQDVPPAPVSALLAGFSAGAPTGVSATPAAAAPTGPRNVPLRVPPAQLESAALQNLQLPNVYGSAAAIPRVDSLRLPANSSLLEAARADRPCFYFLENSRRAPGLDAARLKQDFPILQQTVNGRPLVWLDNAATTQKPQAVIDRLSQFYKTENSNIHRAAHELAARATDAYEGARATAQRFLGAASPNEIVFVRGATEGINLVAQSWGRQNIAAGDEIIVSLLEHHANIVPWKQLADEVGATLKVIPVDDTGQLLLDEYARLLSPRTKLVAVTQVSNALGTITPTSEIVRMAHAVGARALVDGAQSVLHMPTNVQALDADWFVFSGHKVFGPTGIGVLYGKEDLLNATDPWQGGGNMIEDVTFERIRYQNAPARFEAGTGNIADAAGLAAALDYVQRIGLEAIAAHEHALLEYGTHKLRGIPGLRLIGTAAAKAGVLSFVLDGHETSDVGTALNKEGVAVRSGHHCAQPILRRFGLEATVRPSLALYNTFQDLDVLATVVGRVAAGKRR